MIFTFTFNFKKFLKGVVEVLEVAELLRKFNKKNCEFRFYDDEGFVFKKATRKVSLKENGKMFVFSFEEITLEKIPNKVEIEIPGDNDVLSVGLFFENEQAVERGVPIVFKSLELSEESEITYRLIFEFDYLKN